jgi:hypothetical protein
MSGASEHDLDDGAGAAQVFRIFGIKSLFGSDHQKTVVTSQVVV